MKILLTGANGVVGTILREEIKEHTFIPFDLPHCDAINFDQIIQALSDCDAIIHLAWNTKTENWFNKNIDVTNMQMAFNVYRAALASGVKRVIVASSIHVNDLGIQGINKIIHPNDPPSPDSPYGASKLFVEHLGNYFSKQGLEVVCVRISGLNEDNFPQIPTEQDLYSQKKWFSHKDCAELFRAILRAEAVPNNFSVLYGVSNNTGRLVDTINPFGWEPHDDASKINSIK